MDVFHVFQIVKIVPNREKHHILFKKIKLTTCLIYNAVPILMTLTLLPTLMIWKHNYSGREIQPFPFQGFLVRPPPYPHPSNIYVESCPLHRFSIHLSGYIHSLVPPLIKSLKKKNKQTKIKKIQWKKKKKKWKK